MTQFVGNVYRVRPGRSDEYIRRHASIPPGVEQVLREGGAQAFSIYLWGEVVFTHLEVADLGHLVDHYNASEVGERWEAEMGEIIEYPGADPDTGWPERLREVWSL